TPDHTDYRRPSQRETLHRPGTIITGGPYIDERSHSMADVQQVSDDSFQTEVLQASLPVLIDFWAPWCGPCRAIAPIVEELAGTYSGKLKVVKMNVDDNPNTPAKYGVRGIPNLIIFKGGTVQEQIVGAVPKTQLVKAIDKVVA